MKKKYFKTNEDYFKFINKNTNIDIKQVKLIKRNKIISKIILYYDIIK